MPNQPAPPEGTAQFFEKVIEDIRQLLGPAFDALERADRRWRASGTKPRHRLMVMVEALRSDIASFGTSAPAVHIDHLVEAQALLISLQRWQQHPLWSKMVDAVDNEYRHTFMVLATATYFEDNSSSVEFQETRKHRTPDLFLVLGPRDRVAVEVKMPEDLKASKVALGYDKLLDIVKASMEKAGTGPSGQLSPQYPAVLVIGSFQTWPSDMSDFKRAATDYFRESAAWGTHKHVLGIGLLSFVTLLHREPTKTSSQPALQMTHAVNPGNEGTIKLSSETPPHLVR